METKLLRNRVGAMMKKKSKGRKTAKKGRGKASKGVSGKKLDPAKVREDIAGIVKSRARKIAIAVADKAGHGELAPAKFLFEVAHIYPQALEEAVPTENEESLAKTLLDRLNIPESPVIHDLYENGEDVVVIAPRAVQETTDNGSEKKEDALAGVE
jgi:hypothetical protein